MTRIEKLFSRRAQEVSFCWSPFPEERLDGIDGNDVIEGEVAFFHDDETRRCRADPYKYTGEIAFANIY